MTYIVKRKWTGDEYNAKLVYLIVKVTGWWIFKNFQLNGERYENHHFALIRANELNGGDDL